MNEQDTIKDAVRDRYAGHAVNKTSCCCSGSSCCGPTTATAVPDGSYAPGDLSALPADADLGLGCGNPLAFESLAEGETLIDLGSGGGIDCFLAARKVGPTGRVIGIDMTPEMIALARRNAAQGGYTNVEFRLSEVESMSVPDDTADIVISTCVINLVPDKHAAFAEAFRVTRPAGASRSPISSPPSRSPNWPGNRWRPTWRASAALGARRLPRGHPGRGIHRRARDERCGLRDG